MRRILSLVIALVFLAYLSCSRPLQRISFGGNTQGTYYAISYFDRNERNLKPQVDSILHAFDRSVSMWDTGSIISRINNGDAAAVPDFWFKDIYEKSRKVSVETGGAFDFTVGPLVNAWGFGFKGKMSMDQQKVDSLMQFVGYNKVKMDGDGKIHKPAVVMFDFNAIAQGYVVDVIGNYLEDKGINDFLIDIGGEVLGKGWKPDGKPWVVGIESPAADSTSESTLNAMVKLTDMAVSTSGSYRKYRIENGIRYSHTIDPHTGYPVTHSLLSVTVLAPDCATADAYATAFMVMGLDKAKDFLEHHPGLEAYFIIPEEGGIYSTYASKGFKEIFVRQ
jgi:FAD:protein FMN transferase